MHSLAHLHICLHVYRKGERARGYVCFVRPWCSDTYERRSCTEALDLAAMEYNFRFHVDFADGFARVWNGRIERFHPENVSQRDLNFIVLPSNTHRKQYMNDHHDMCRMTLWSSILQFFLNMIACNLKANIHRGGISCTRKPLNGCRKFKLESVHESLKMNVTEQSGCTLPDDVNRMWWDNSMFIPRLSVDFGVVSEYNGKSAPVNVIDVNRKQWFAKSYCYNAEAQTLHVCTQSCQWVTFGRLEWE
jgi:hypothetical protein